MNLYEELWKQLPIPAFVVDPLDNVIELNVSAEQFLGISRKLVLDQKMWKFLLGENLIPEGLKRARSKNTSVLINDVSAYGRSTYDVVCSVHICPLPSNNQNVLLIIIPIEGLEYQSKKMVRTTSTQSVIGMGEMLAHEIKNPVAGIIGAAQFLSMSLTAEEIEMTDLIVEESKRIVSLLEQVEQFGDITPPKLMSLNIHDVLDQSVKTAKFGFAGNIKIIREYDPSLPSVWGDRDQLVQAFLNLVKNACEAVDQNGQIIIRTFYDGSLQSAKLGLDGQRLSLHIEIIDDGAGLLDSIAKHIFEPFVSSKNNSKGLGLALVSKILSQHAAHIEASSKLGKTIFRISFPLSC
jgi:two-component system nitrogen regulation sensor histidine kinase GlnL